MMSIHNILTYWRITDKKLQKEEAKEISVNETALLTHNIIVCEFILLKFKSYIYYKLLNFKIIKSKDM